ncbi:TSUP family transporter [Cellulophaga sp. BC115SP]|nr:TSUP family transporter [Cellulophaga sp. BC115SP]
MVQKILSNRAVWYIAPTVLLFSSFIVLIYSGNVHFSWSAIQDGFNSDFGFYVLVGLGAQLVDGTLGMAYGVTSTSFLLSLGVPPAVSSTSVHVAEMFTTGASAISHFKFGNINKKLFRNLLIPGVLGSITGAYLLADFIDGNVIKPYISIYMIILGIIIIRKALQKNIVKQRTKRLGLLAVFGGFMDSIGGGGWGPIVTSSLLGRGRDPRYTIGSVNAAEFAVSFASGITFLLFEGVNSWQVVLGLIVGGTVASPLGAIFVNKVKRKPMMILVGTLVIIISLRTIIKSFHLI